MSAQGGKFVIRALAPDDVCKIDLAHEDDALRAFLKKSANKFHSSNIAKTYVAVEDTPQGQRIRSYISILLSEIKKEYANADDCPEAARYNFPAIKIGRLATDRRYEKKGLAGDLIAFIAGLAQSHIMPYAGCRFLILDANQVRVDYYKKRGFVLVQNADNLADQNPVMFMDLHRIAQKTQQ